MKKIKFIRLEIKDFQGILHYSFDFKEGVTRLLGTNSSGKSSVIDSIIWIITGRNQKNQSDSNFEIVPLNDEGRMIPTAEPHGSLTIEVDGVERTIERKLKLKVPKTADGVIDYSTRFKTERKFFIDGLNFKAGQFNKELQEIFGDDETFKTLTNVVHFGNNKSEKDQRSLLLSYIKPVTHEMLCEIDERFKSLNELEKLEFGDVLGQTRARIIESKKEIEANKNRIDEVKLSLLEFKDVDLNAFGKIEIARTKIQNEINQMNKDMSAQDLNASKKRDLDRDLLSIEWDIKNFNANFNNKKDMDVEGLERKITNETSKRDNCDTIREDLVSTFESLNVKITNAETEVEEIIKAKTIELQEENTRKINSESSYFDGIINRFKQDIVNKRNEKVEDTCTACEQSLPLESVEQVKKYIQNAIEGFENKITETEADKEGKLLQINNSHKDAIKNLEDSKATMISSRTNGYIQEAQGINGKGKENATNKGLYQIEIDKLGVELSSLKATTANQGEKDMLYGKKETIEADIEKLVGSKTVSYDDIRKKQLELDVLNNQLNSKDSITRNKNRQKELKLNQKSKIKGLSDLEDKKLLLEEYLQFKNNLLSKELKNHFNKDITFKFIEWSQDSVPKDVFKMLIKGVPYSNANTAGRILAGKQIITFLQDKLEIRLPILIDNKESVVISTDYKDLQVLEAIAHKDYPVLTVE
jgi:hypothetical protein